MEYENIEGNARLFALWEPDEPDALVRTAQLATLQLNGL